MKKKVLVLASLMFALMGTSLKAQLNVGSASAPNTDAALQITSPNANKGILFPLVALKSTTSASPLSAHVQGMVVFNTATIGDVTPAIYYNDGTKWLILGGTAAASVPSGTDVIRTAIVNGGNSADLANYDAAVLNAVINVSLASYNAIQAITSAATILETNAYMASTPTDGGISVTNYTESVPAAAVQSTYFTAGQYMVAFQLKNKSFNNGANDQGGIIKFASSPAGTYSDYCGAMPSVPLVANYSSRYYVIKTPNKAIPATPTMAVYASSTWMGDQVGSSAHGGVASNYATGNQNTLSTTTINSYLYIQAIEIPTKQW